VDASEPWILRREGSVGIRPFLRRDAAELCEAVLESRRELSPWIPWCHAGYGIDDAEAFLAGVERARANDEAHHFAVVGVGEGRLLGASGLSEIFGHRANLGYWVRTSATGRGVATTAARLVAAHGFETLGFERLEIVVARGNERSMRVAERVGAEREGLLRRRVLVGDDWQDAWMYSLVRDDAR